MAEVVPFMFGGYRSFRSTPHRLPVVGKLNLIAGANNSGKSNVLRFVEANYENFLKGIRSQRVDWGWSSLDRFQGEGDGSVWFGVGLELGGPEHEALRSHDDVIRKLRTAGPELVDRVLSALSDDGTHAWFIYRASTPGAAFEPVFPEGLESAIARGDWSRLWNALTGRQQGDLHQHWIPQTVDALRPTPDSPPVVMVDAIRKVGDSGSESVGYSGLGIIDRLAQYQNPARDRQGDKLRFTGINRFLQTVLDDDSAQLEVPYARDTILVHQAGRTLPLAHLGTGVHEVIILAAAATVLNGHVICVEEPELHLHPILQRKLVRYLAENTQNQYFITTHSAALLDTPGAAIYHVGHDGSHSSVRLAASASERFEICGELGFRASDLLQANCVVWVEGPSDRIYIRHWISAVAPDLIEGIHYSIMFYGGRLLAHVSANDPEVDDFISLRRLNRHVVIVMDSDIKSKGGVINATKTRVRDELAGQGVAWVTEGREIENYVPRPLMAPAIRKAVPAAEEVPRWTRYQSATRYVKQGGSIEPVPDKVKLAHLVAEEDPSFDVLDLRERIEEVVEYIRQANG